MPRGIKNNPWRLINKCLICGAPMRFVKSDRADAKQYDGAKVCDKNHSRFAVIGRYSALGVWGMSFHLPESRHER